MKKLVNGIEMDMTSQEITQREADIQQYKDNELNFKLENLRFERNNLLAETDYLALSDNTMSSEMTTYRQSLRDITNGLTTVEEVNAVVFPTKPEENE